MESKRLRRELQTLDADELNTAMRRVVERAAIPNEADAQVAALEEEFPALHSLGATARQLGEDLGERLGLSEEDVKHLTTGVIAGVLATTLTLREVIVDREMGGMLEWEDMLNPPSDL